MTLRRTPKDKIEIAEKVLTDYKTGKYTFDSACEKNGVPERTFRTWCSEIAEIADMLKEAKSEAIKARRQELKQISLTALGRMITGFHEFEEVQDIVPVYDKDGNEIAKQIKNLRKIKKYIPPSVTAIIFALKAVDPENFKDVVSDSQKEPQKFIIGGKEVIF